MLEAGVKGLLLLSVVMLLGAGLYPRFVGSFAPTKVNPWLLRMSLLGAVGVVLFSVLNILTTLYRVLGYLEPSFVWDYTLSTNHGRATLLRLGLVIGLVGLQVRLRQAGRASNALYVLMGTALLLSFSWISHNASMGGRLPVVADLVHFAAATAWAGAVLVSAFLPVWREANRTRLKVALGRVSAIGLVAVGLLIVTGLYSAWLHVGEPVALITTRYGWSLVAKVGLVLVILSIAGLNRWVFLPRLGSSTDLTKFSRMLKVEAVLLLLVLGLTGLLTTSPVPH